MNKAILITAALFAFGVAAQAQNATPSPAASMSPKSTKSMHHHKKHKTSKSSM
ncbi:MAG TPA: hypothetical protein VGD78_17415 [Chthoniobacterales bacterium]